MNRILFSTVLFFLLSSSLHCTHTPQQTQQPAAPAKATAPAAKVSTSAKRTTASEDWIDALPAGNSSEYIKDIEEKVRKGSQGQAERDRAMVQRIAKYVAFVMGDYRNTALQTKPKETVKKALIKRIFESSTQFLLCPDLSDFECLEAYPEVTPSLASRVEDPSRGLGAKQVVNADFEKSTEYYFNELIFVPEDEVDFKKTLAAKLESKINAISSKNNDAIYMALYGIDDIEKTDSSPGSMRGVYTSLLDKIDKGIPVKAVFDQQGLNAHAPKPGLFTYVRPTREADLKKWILTPLDPANMPNDPKTGNPKKMLPSDYTNMNFQYDYGTQGLIEALAKDARTDEEAEGRIEFKSVGAIMHNKFFVFKKGDNYSVWTGTANVARTCMGTERNSNLGVYITNNEIAQVFIEEFNEMYEFITPTPKNTEKAFVGRDGNIPQGRFHKNKKANTHRYFHFSKDGTDVRVYFSPTDDAEHRAILPMIHAAHEGDILRLSMFGAGGLELARALQLAASRGVTVEIIADTPTSRGVNQFLGATGESTLFNPNPFSASAQIALKNNDLGPGGTWGQNHQKIGALIRSNGKVEQLIFGSQNWSGVGNDTSDENLIALRNPKGLKIGAAFNKHFTEFLWPKGEVSVLKTDEGGGGEEGSEE